MARRLLYGEELAPVSYSIPKPVKEAVRRLAADNHQSASQLVTIILEDYVRRRGELREPEPVGA